MIAGELAEIAGVRFWDVASRRKNGKRVCMLDVAATPGDAAEDGGPEGSPIGHPRAVLLTFVPNSSIQFVDFQMAEGTAVQTRRRFFEDVSEDGEASLHVAASSDGVFYHPVTNVPCNPAHTYTIGGLDALAPFLDAWLPLPFMRVSRRGEDDELGLDEGPSNWTRVMISRVRTAGGAHRYRVVLAVDTCVDAQPATASRAYVGPTLEDLKSAAAFRFSDDPNDVAWFVSEAWVDDWLKEAFVAGRATDGPRAGADGSLEHLATYLTLLAVLKDACDLPALRFMEPNAVGAYAQTIPVDLALDLGTSRTSVLLCESDTARGGKNDRDSNAKRGMRELPLRDLSQPWRKARGTFSSRIVFSRVTFGNEALSRWSGRTQAFHWPSLVRLGAEAERLACEPTSAEATTGVSSPMHYVWDERPSRDVWRFAGTRADATVRRNPVVSGSILALLTESGDLLESRGTPGGTTKPRFSRSSLVTMLVGEILLHAIGAINAPQARERRGKPTSSRRLDRIVVTPPAGMPEAEIAVLRRRVENAVKLVWRSMGWAQEAHPLAPPPPSVLLVADAATSSQIAWLENEIAYKFRGKADGLLALAGRSRAGFAGARTLRIATLDIGGAATGVSVATYEAAPGGALAASRQLVEGFEIGCDDVVKAFAERYVLAALAQRLNECKHADPAKLIAALLGPDDRGRPAWVGDLGRRLTAELLAPAATALMRLYAHSESDAGDVPAELSIATLLASAGVGAKSVADRLDIVAADDGADGFAPLDVMVPFVMRDLGAVAREVLRPMLDNVVRVLAALDCDVVLLGGGGAHLPAVTEIMLAGMPLRPDRVIALHQHRFAPWYPGRDARLVPIAGALVQARGSLGEGGPALVMRPLARTANSGFIGKLGDDGRIVIDDVLFEAASENGTRTGSPAPRTRSVAVGLPGLIGQRTPSLESWPARATWVIERDPAVGGRLPKLPIKATLELSHAERGMPVALKLVSAIDGDGGRLDPTEVVLRLKTRRFAVGYWLDTGHLNAGQIKDGHLDAARTGTGL